MNTHLSDIELMEAAEPLDETGSGLPPARRRHLDQCEACRASLAAWRDTTMALAAGRDVPEPSPLFWDHFSDRVRMATASEPIREATWWERVWRPAVALSAALSAAALVIMMRMPP